MRRIAWVTGIGFAVAALLAPFAQAEGGNSIASAPPVPFGKLQTGTIANGLEDDGALLSLWKLKIKAGDTVTIDWAAARGTNIEVFPQGTNDFTLSKATPLHRSGIGATGKNEFKFVASKSGVMPLAFETIAEYAAPYSFTARVKRWHPR